MKHVSRSLRIRGAGLALTLIASGVVTGLSATAGASTKSAPSNSSPPTISGTAQEGQTLKADPGTWSGSTPIDYSYQWRRCGTGGKGDDGGRCQNGGKPWEGPTSHHEFWPFSGVERIAFWLERYQPSSESPDMPQSQTVQGNNLPGSHAVTIRCRLPLSQSKRAFGLVYE